MAKENTLSKKVIDDKVAKVREVVHGVNTNDIILALHSFEMDVNKTIQAFCEDGASAVLDDWVRPAGSKNKKNNKKKVAAAAEVPAAAPAPSTASAPAPAPTPKKETAPAPAPATSKSQTNGHAEKVMSKQDQKPVANGVASSSGQNDAIKNAFKAVKEAIAQRENALVAQMAGSNGATFSYDMSDLISAINSFGSVTGKKVAAAPAPVQVAAPVKAAPKADSPAPAADSGLGNSPVDKKKQPQQPVAQVASGGIQMASDALSPDQLAELQRKLQLQLSAQGIDASVLSGVSSGDMPVRRPRPPRNDKKPAHKKPMLA